LSELQKLGFAVSETTVSRYVRRFREHNSNPDVLKRWITFLRKHRAIAGMDLFTVPTATPNVIYGFFVIHHDRRRIPAASPVVLKNFRAAATLPKL